jgi:hypothetical protein
MMRAIPALTAVFMGMLGVIPWAPRELGWYAADIGVRMPAMAPMISRPQLAKNPNAWPIADKPVAASDLNRAHGYVVAMIVAFLPYVSAVALSPHSYKPWVFAKHALRAIA